MRRLDRADAEETAAQLKARRQIHEHNRRLDELRNDLESVMQGRAIEVSSLADTFPLRDDRPRRDLLLIGIGDPEDGAWLVERLRHPAPDEGKPSDDEWAGMFELPGSGSIPVSL